MLFRSLTKHLPTPALLDLIAGGSYAAFAPTAAQAAGFTGPFAPNQWTLNSYLNPPGSLPATGTAQESLGSPANDCSNFDPSVNCVTVTPPEVQGNATLAGSDSAGHGGTGEAWATQWEMTYNEATSKTFLFDWTYISNDSTSSDQSYYYVIDASNNPTLFPLSSNNGDPNTNVSVTLLPGYKFGFGVYTASNIGEPGFLAIQNFDADLNAVPGPLPIFGGAAAWSWSRRLRSRVRRASAA